MHTVADISFFCSMPALYSHGPELFYKFVSKISNTLVKQLLSMTVCCAIKNDPLRQKKNVFDIVVKKTNCEMDNKIIHTKKSNYFSSILKQFLLNLQQCGQSQFSVCYQNMIFES